MSVYVDNLFPTVRTRRWPYVKACHMIADSLPELCDMMRQIDLKWSWYQQSRVKPGDIGHFNLTAGKRRAAIRAGAVPLNRDCFIKKFCQVRARLKADS